MMVLMLKIVFQGRISSFVDTICIEKPQELRVRS